MLVRYHIYEHDSVIFHYRHDLPQIEQKIGLSLIRLTVYMLKKPLCNTNDICFILDHVLGKQPILRAPKKVIKAVGRGGEVNIIEWILSLMLAFTEDFYRYLCINSKIFTLPRPHLMPF